MVPRNGLHKCIPLSHHVCIDMRNVKDLKQSKDQRIESKFLRGVEVEWNRSLTIPWTKQVERISTLSRQLPNVYMSSYISVSSTGKHKPAVCRRLLVTDANDADDEVRIGT